jgi:hypothetical protein
VAFSTVKVPCPLQLFRIKFRDLSAAEYRTHLQSAAQGKLGLIEIGVLIV